MKEELAMFFKVLIYLVIITVKVNGMLLSIGFQKVIQVSTS